ncbi:MAG TPA: hypothetical protein VMR45_04960 [Patescibacteria group bacterium]|nr:hypothetical protein [Patescibacteria group bacterium]
MKKQNISKLKVRSAGRAFVAVLALAPFWAYAPAVMADADLSTHHSDSATTTRVSVATDGTQAPNGAESTTPRSMSANGRFVAFSTLSGLDPIDTNGQSDIYVRDTKNQTTTLVSVTADGTQAAGGSKLASISANGRYVVFYAYPDTLVPNDTNGVGDTFVRDLVHHTTTRVNVASNGDQANGSSGIENPAQISADGRYVAFDSFATNLVPNDTNGRQDVFLHDRNTGRTTRVSVGANGVEANANGSGSMAPALSEDGRYVAFASDSTNLVANDTNNSTDIFVRDRQHGTTTRVSVASDGTQGNDASIRPTISDNGRYVAFEGWGSSLVANDTNNAPDIFVRDRQHDTLTRVSVAQDGTQSNDQSRYASISGDGRFVAFQSMATNIDSLGSGDTNGNFDIFVKNIRNGEVTRENVTPAGGLSNGFAMYPSLNANGRYVAFVGGGSDLVAGDTNHLSDVFLRQRF